MKKKNTMAYQVKLHLYMVHHAYVLLHYKWEQCKDKEEKQDLLEKKNMYLTEQHLLEEIMRKCGYYREIDNIEFLARAAADYQIETDSSSKYKENIDLIRQFPDIPPGRGIEQVVQCGNYPPIKNISYRKAMVIL